MLSMISIPVTALAVGLPEQRPIAQRFSALALFCHPKRRGLCPLMKVKLTQRGHGISEEIDTE